MNFITEMVLAYFLVAPPAEWTLHKYFMHKAFLGVFQYPFQAHAVTHHGTFKYDHTYHLQDMKDWNLIRMALWNGPVISLTVSIPFFIGHWIGGAWYRGFAAFLGFFLYYLTYESLHMIMHLPKVERRRLRERIPFFKQLNGHHLLHHKYMDKNFNVVLPWFDLATGTLVLRAKRPFPQPESPAVPDVQPLPGDKRHWLVRLLRLT